MGVHSNHIANNTLERTPLHFLRSWCRLCKYVPGRTIYRELGELPLQYYWWRALFSFWNQVLAADNTGVSKQVLGDAYQLRTRGSWGARVKGFFQETVDFTIIEEALLATGAYDAYRFWQFFFF